MWGCFFCLLNEGTEHKKKWFICAWLSPGAEETAMKLEPGPPPLPANSPLAKGASGFSSFRGPTFVRTGNWDDDMTDSEEGDVA